MEYAPEEDADDFEIHERNIPETATIELVVLGICPGAVNGRVLYSVAYSLQMNRVMFHLCT